MKTEETKVVTVAKCYFIFLLLCYALAPFHRTVPSTIGLEIMNDFNINNVMISVMGAVFFYFYAVMQIPAGILADRFGAKETCSIFLFIAGLGTFLFSLSSNFYLACFGRILIGIGVAMIFVPGLKIILNWFPHKMHPICTGMFLSLGTGGMFLASWPLAKASEFMGWRMALTAIGILTVVLAVVCWIWVKNDPEKSGRQQDQTSETIQTANQLSLKKSIKYILTSKSYWAISLWFFSLFGIFYAFSGLWAGPYFTEAYHLSSDYKALVLSCISAGAIIGPSIFGFILSWLSVTKKFLMFLVCLLGIFFSIPLIVPYTIVPHAVLPVWFFFFSICIGGCGSLGLIKIQDDFPKELVGTATGMVNIYTALGGGIIQMSSGWIMNLLNPEGSNTIQTYSQMFILFIVLLALAAVIVLFLLSKHNLNTSVNIENLK